VLGVRNQGRRGHLIKPISATAIERARGCLRKAAFHDVAGIRLKSKYSAITGTRVHAVQEAWLRSFVPPAGDPYGALVIAGLPYLPHPGSGYVEQHFETTIDGIPFHGVIDLLCPVGTIPQAPPEFSAMDPMAPCVLDAKTSKNPRAYGIWSKEERLDDAQTLIYDEILECDVANRWLYYPKTQAVLQLELQAYLADGGTDPLVIEKGQRGINNSPRTCRPKPSDCVLTRREIRGGIERIVLPMAETLIRMRERAPNPLDVEPNTDHCDAFGGCEYLGTHCNPTTTDIANSLFGGNEMGSLWDKLPGINGAPAPAAAPPLAVEAPAVPAAPAFAFNFGTAPVAAAPAPAPVPVVPPSATPAPVAGPMSDPLVRIGNALIAAGRALGGQ
jgi:hypothetical protein